MTSFPIPGSIDMAASVVAYLDPKLGPAGTQVPDPRPDRFIEVHVAPRTREDVVVDESLVTLTVWGPRGGDVETSHRARMAHALMLNWEGTQEGELIVYRCDALSGPTEFPDPDSDAPRYVATFVVTHRATLYLTQGADHQLTLTVADTDYAAQITN